jgi:4-hydroxy-3-polyprenylbenzoate decarboxylase
MGKKIVVAVTGASGSVYASRLLEKFSQYREQLEDVGIIFSPNALDIWAYELGRRPDAEEFGFRWYAKTDFYAPFASGSAGWDTMIIIPCSMGTLGRIAAGVSDDLITRAADVILKERRKLILVPRENPYSLIHLRNMTLLTEAGAIIAPATPSFYSLPKSVDAVVDTVVNRILDLAGIENSGYRWGSEG